MERVKQNSSQTSHRTPAFLAQLYKNGTENCTAEHVRRAVEDIHEQHFKTGKPGLLLKVSVWAGSGAVI